MAIAVDPNTGWSEALQVKATANKGSDSSYGLVNATWFYESWFNSNRWARKFTNLTNMRLQMKSGSFTVCSGHSNGKQFMSTGGLLTVNGGGCQFHADIYIEGSSEAVTTSDTITLQDLAQDGTGYNCSASGGPGTTSTTSAYGTGFGKVKYFGPGTGRDLDSNGHKRYSHLETVTFAEGPIIEPGQSVYVVITPTNFDSGRTCLLVIEKSVTSWEAVMEPAPSDYIWVYTSTGWVKKKTAMGYDGSTWSKLEVE